VPPSPVGRPPRTTDPSVAPSCARADRGSPPYRGIDARYPSRRRHGAARPHRAYKRRRLLQHTRRPPAAALHGRRSESSTSSCNHGRPTPRTPPLGSLEAQAATLSPAFRRPSPDGRPPRPPLGCTVVGHHWSSLHPVRAGESSPRDPHAVPRPRPAGPGCRFAGIQPEHRRPVPKGPIGRGKFFPRVDLHRKGLSIRNQKFLGTLVKSSFLNSTCVWLKLVKCIENHRKFRKIQTQFCSTPGEKPYNFCKACLCFFLISFAGTIEM
jgi:hypothetical protein